MFLKDTKTTLLVVFFTVLIAFLSPLFPYLIKGLGLTRDIITSTETLRQTNGRTNLLLLGLGGQKNEPSGLTDTILFTSYNPQANKALMLSLPRDLWVPQMQAKINTAYYYGNQVEGLGMEWSRRYVSEIVGQPVHYVVVISFEGFVKIVDLLGGVDVQIDKAFTDTEYPIPGKEDDLCEGDPKTLCRFETITFSQGVTHMDGMTALKFARSRHSEGDEGTDFARSSRQQKIILAVRGKIFSTEVLLNPKKLSQLLKVAGDSVETDIPDSHIAAFIKIALGTQNTQVSSQILGHVDEKGFLVNPPISQKYLKQYVLIPRTDSWQPAQEWIACLLEKEDCPIEEYTKSIKD